MNRFAQSRVARLLPVMALAMACMGRPVAAADDVETKLAAITWKTGPAKVNVGSNATLDLPAGYRFADGTGAAQFMKLTGNLYGNQIGVVIPPKGQEINWYVLYDFDEVGYVKDDDKLDDSAATTILDSLKKGNEQGNARRTSQGLDTLILDGWSQKPFYDAVTHSVTWGIALHSGADVAEKSINYSARVLGRRGVMECELVLSPEDLQSTIPQFQKLVTAVAYTPGDTYAEFRSGDKIAQYGLVGLIAGGAAVVAVKFIKPLIALVAVVIGGIGAMLKKIKNFFTGNKG